MNAFITIVLLITTCFITACGATSVPTAPDAEAVDQKPSLFRIPDKALSSNLSLKAFAIIDDLEPTHDLSVFSTYVGGTIIGLTEGVHVVSVHLQAHYEIRDIWVDIVTIAKNVTIVPGTTVTLQAQADDLNYPDNDNDGISNLDELIIGTDPNNSTPLDTVRVGYMDAWEFRKGTCGDVPDGIMLPNPMRTDTITLSLTNVYNMDGSLFISGLTTWLIEDTSCESVLETNYNERTFTTDDGMTCDWGDQKTGLADALFAQGALSPIVFHDDILMGRSVVIRCSKGGDTCSITYDGK